MPDRDAVSAGRSSTRRSASILQRVTDPKIPRRGPPLPIFSTALTLLTTAITVGMGLNVHAPYAGALIFLLGGLFAASIGFYAIVLGIAWAATPPRRNRLLAVMLPILLPIAGLVVGFGIAEWQAGRDAAREKEEARAIAKESHKRMVSKLDRCSAAVSLWGADYVAGREARCTKLAKPTCYYFGRPSSSGAQDPDDLPDGCAWDVDGSHYDDTTVCCTAPVTMP